MSIHYRIQCAADRSDPLSWIYSSQEWCRGVLYGTAEAAWQALADNGKDPDDNWLAWRVVTVEQTEQVTPAPRPEPPVMWVRGSHYRHYQLADGTGKTRECVWVFDDGNALLANGDTYLQREARERPRWKETD